MTGTRYDFLLLAMLFVVPGLVVAALRPDLRPLILRMSVASLPFAATEALFYPEYWRPRFLFDLADRIGFGIEDVLFVVGLAAFATTAYAVVAGRTLELPVPTPLRAFRRGGVAIAGTLGLALGLVFASVPILYAAVLAMAISSGVMLASRTDLILPACLGAITTGALYLALCLVFQVLVPGVFTTAWRPSVLLRDVAFLGVPCDEVLYGVASGFVATIFPAWVYELRFTQILRIPSQD